MECSSRYLEEAPLLDLLLRRYGSIEYVLGLDADVSAPLILYAERQERDDQIRRQWTALLPLMSVTGIDMSFEEYRDQVTGSNIDMRPASEILAEIAEIEKQLEEVHYGS